MDILDNIFPQIQADFKYLFNSSNPYVNNSEEIIKSLLLSIRGMRTNLQNQYTSSRNLIDVYEKQLLNRLKQDGSIELIYLNEEFCKDVPKCKLAIHDLKNSKMKDMNKLIEMENLLLANKVSQFPKLDKIKDASSIDSKFQKLYRCLLFNPKKELKYMTSKAYADFCKKVFLSDKSILTVQIDSIYKFNEYTRKNYMIADLNQLLGLLKDYEDILNNLRKPKIPRNLDESKKIKYVKDYIFFISKMYQNMYGSAYMLFMAKMTARESLLKQSINK